MEFIDFFCGAGLFTEGMKEAGHKPIMAFDKWPLAIKSYNENHKVGICSDILNLNPSDLPHVDLIIGSPPCQEFSSSNNLRTHDLSLINKFLEIITYIKPKYWIMENVPGVSKFIPSYVPNLRIYPASFFGGNQLRRRMFAGAFNPIMAPFIKKHKVSGLTGALARHKLNGPRHYNRTDNQRMFEYFGYQNPTIDILKEEMGAPRGYALCGTYNQQVMQLINGVYVPLIKKLGEAL